MSFQASQYSDPADLSAVRSSRISSTSGKGFTTSCRLPSGPNYMGPFTAAVDDESPIKLSRK